MLATSRCQGVCRYYLSHKRFNIVRRASRRYGVTDGRRVNVRGQLGNETINAPFTDIRYDERPYLAVRARAREDLIRILIMDPALRARVHCGVHVSEGSESAG
jgi:hypothetical protein